jgi:Xaa-Pro aminopeptidase
MGAKVIRIARYQRLQKLERKIAELRRAGQDARAVAALLAALRHAISLEAEWPHR